MALNRSKRSIRRWRTEGLPPAEFKE
jgi:hypothetical protein